VGGLNSNQGDIMESYWRQAPTIGPQTLFSRRSALDRALVGDNSSFPFMSVEEARSRFPQDGVGVEVKNEPTGTAGEEHSGNPLID
jgi:hypothetical protein